MLDRKRPKEGWLGHLIATDTSTLNKTAAYEIKNEMFRLADETNEPIFVETTQRRIMLLYKVTGYYEYDAIPHPYEGLTIWFMRRDPGT